MYCEVIKMHNLQSDNMYVIKCFIILRTIKCNNKTSLDLLVGSCLFFAPKSRYVSLSY